jgi:hypothetical protein
VARLARRLDGLPRHLGIHTGGMLLTAKPLIETVPVERARMPDRTVAIWDKDVRLSIAIQIPFTERRGFEELPSRLLTSPNDENPRGTQHGEKAGTSEDVYDMVTRKTCTIR